MALQEADLEREMDFGDVNNKKLSGLLKNGDMDKNSKIVLREALQYFDTVYSGKIGYEFLHCRDSERVNWLQERIERKPFENVPVEKKNADAGKVGVCDNF